FSKSMNIASFRSPFIQVVLSSALLSRGVGWVSTASIICPSFGPPGQVYDLPHEKARSRRGRPGAARPGPDREVARPDVWPHAPLRSQTLGLPLLRPGGPPDAVDVGGVPAPAADHRALRRPLRHALVEARQRAARRPVEGGALLRSGDARDAADARRSRAHAARAQLMAVRVEHAGAVTTIVLDRPEARNAVDRDTAAALADAFRAFEADAAARVAVLWGANGTFCA